MPRRELSVNMNSHNGLRGLCSVWIMMYHFLKMSIGFDILGNIAMPIFFILSGFSLSVVYGASVEGKSYFLNIAEFYRNRFARIYPVYILTTFLPHCLVFTDYSFEFIKVPTFSFETMDAASWISSIFLNVLVVQTWPILLGIPYRYRAFLVRMIKHE